MPDPNSASHQDDDDHREQVTTCDGYGPVPIDDVEVK
jgi:hypothetical protein